MTRAALKPPTFLVAQWAGNNKRDIDDVAGTKSRRVGDELVNDEWLGAHRMKITDWIVQFGDVVPGPMTDVEFNERFVIV